MFGIPLSFKLMGPVLALGMLVSQSQCTGVHGTADATYDSNSGLDWNVTANSGYRFITRINTMPEYHLRVQGYPYNRLLAYGYWVRTDWTTDTPTVTKSPMTLQVGAHLPFSVEIGSKTLNYTGTIVASTNCPQGTYVLDTPGAVAQIQYWLNTYPDAGMSISFSSGSNGTGIAALLPAQDQATDQEGVSPVTIDMASSGLQVWRTMTTKDPDLGGNPFYTWHQSGAN